VYSLGSKIKELRMGRNLTQDELAIKLNDMFGTTINKSMISKWENNKEDPSLDNGRKLVAFFGISLDELLGLDQPPLQTIAAHHEGEDWSEEELEVIRNFKEFVKSQRPKE